MSEGGGTPRDERFATPRTFRSQGSSKSDSKSTEENWQTPRQTLLHRQSSINSNSDFDFRSPRGMLSSEAESWPDYNPLPSARSHSSNSELNQYTAEYGYPEAKGSSRSSRPLNSHPEEEEEPITLGVAEGLTEQDVVDIFRYARHGRIDDMEYLLNRGIPIHIRDEFGSTLLTIACQNGNKRVAKLVLRKGADINTRNHKGEVFAIPYYIKVVLIVICVGNTPLHYCYQCKSVLISALFIMSYEVRILPIRWLRRHAWSLSHR
jgi:hypothetical protein